MFLNEYAKKHDITLAVAANQLGLKSSHWKTVVPEQSENVASVDEFKEVVKFVEEVIAPAITAPKPSDIIKEAQEVMKMLMKDGIDAKMALRGIVMIGKKSSYFKYALILKTLLD